MGAVSAIFGGCAGCGSIITGGVLIPVVALICGAIAWSKTNKK